MDQPKQTSPGERSKHYFDADPEVASAPHDIELVLPDVYLKLTTDRGVFSGGKVDSGTRYLLRSHPPISDGVSTILDLGCGYGPIGLVAAKRAPQATVWGVDVNSRAIALATRNAEANNISNARFCEAADVPPDITFDLLLSNPPIRIGKAALHELMSTWLARVTPGGRAWMVVQKHLGSDSLARWLSAQGWPTTKLASKKGYRILETSVEGSE